jgi:hypothetical protein
MTAATHRSPLVLLLILATGLWGGAACRPSFNADELIAATLSGRAGEIATNLRSTLPQDEKRATAAYLAALEPLAGELLRLLQEAEALQLQTRASGAEITAAYRKLAGRAGEIAGAVKELAPPAPLAAAHEELVLAYAAYGAAAAKHAEAFASMDFAALRELRADHDLSRRRILAAHEHLERDAVPLFQPDKPFKIRPQR